MLSARPLLLKIICTVLVIFSLSLGIDACSTKSENNFLSVLSIVGGNVLIQKADNTNWNNGTNGMILKAGDRIKTDSGATATITFFDGSTINLNSNTEISLDTLINKSSSKSIELSQEIGETISHAVKLMDPTSKYQITTPSAVAAVGGTIMQVLVNNDGSTSVANVEGNVNVTAQGKEVIIPAGEHSIVNVGQGPSEPLPGVINSFGVLGNLWTWGENQYGQLGNGTSVDSNIPISVNSLSGVVAASGGDYGGLALKSDNTVWTWGANASGQLGNGTTTNSLTPIQVPSLTGIVSISAGYYHDLALQQNGTVWVWGDNNHGQLGDGTTTNSGIPIQVRITGIVAISGGYYHSLALKSDGTVWAWGANDNGQLGNGTNVDSLVPVQVVGLNGVVAISAGDYHNLALKSDGSVWAWGANDSGQLGNGTTTDSNTPVQVTSLSGTSAISAGGRNSLALTSNGTVWGWGLNDNGELGNNTTVDSSVPVEVNLPSGIIAISIRDQHSLALTSDGGVWSWGWNGYGQLGTGTTANSAIPVLLNGITGVVSIDAGVYYSLAISAAPTITLFKPNINGLSVSINGVTLPTVTGASITGIVWNWGDGHKITGWFPQSHTYSQAGTYNVDVISTDSNGRSQSASITVSVK